MLFHGPRGFSVIGVVVGAVVVVFEGFKPSSFELVSGLPTRPARSPTPTYKFKINVSDYFFSVVSQI